MHYSSEKKIILVANSIRYLNNFQLDLIKALHHEKYQIITIANGEMKKQHKLMGLVRHYDWPVSPVGMNVFYEQTSLWKLFKIIKNERPVALLCFTAKGNIYGNIAARLAKVPSISNISGLGSAFISGGIKKLILLTLYKVALIRTAYVFFQNDEDQILFSNYIGMSESRILPGSGVNTDVFIPQKRNNRNSKFIFLFVGRLIKDKGIIEYADAANIVQAKGLDAKFLVLGEKKPDNPSALSNEEFEEYILNRELEYIGTTDDVVKVINDVDCVVLPSYREGTPKSLLEAMSCGKPILTTNVPGCSRTVDHGKNGFLCDVKSPASLAAQMEKFLNLSHDEIIGMGNQSRKKALHDFDVNIVINEYLSAINKVTEIKSLT